MKATVIGKGQNYMYSIYEILKCPEKTLCITDGTIWIKISTDYWLSDGATVSDAALASVVEYYGGRFLSP